MKATGADLLVMLRNLLEDRFKLKFRREDRIVAGYALVMAKDKPSLREADGVEDFASVLATRMTIQVGRPISVHAKKYSTAMLANLLTRVGPGPVIDASNLRGVYDFDLSWDETAGATLSTALQQQLGFRLRPLKVTRPYFIFESAERPTEN